MIPTAADLTDDGEIDPDDITAQVEIDDTGDEITVHAEIETDDHGSDRL